MTRPRLGLPHRQTGLKALLVAVEVPPGLPLNLRQVGTPP